MRGGACFAATRRASLSSPSGLFGRLGVLISALYRAPWASTSPRHRVGPARASCGGRAPRASLLREVPHPGARVRNRSSIAGGGECGRHDPIRPIQVEQAPGSSDLSLTLPEQAPGSSELCPTLAEQASPQLRPVPEPGRAASEQLGAMPDPGRAGFARAPTCARAWSSSLQAARTYPFPRRSSLWRFQA